MFHWDVTREYVKTSDPVISLLDVRLKDKYAYIATFSERTLHVVDFGVVKHGKAHFTNIGRNIAYVVVEYDGRELVPVSEPFFLHENGQIEYRKADTSAVQTARLMRKYPKSRHVALVEQRLVGGSIEASNNKNFSPCATLYTIDSYPSLDLFPLTDTTRYRYWRYRAPEKTYCNIAELQFYEAGCDTVARGKAMGTVARNTMSHEKAFDGDWLTIFHSNGSNDEWVGLDFGRPVCVNRVRCVPRSDDNGIHFGDTYELNYWHRDGWQSLGRQIAQDNALYYENVPQNALLLLQNHTRGRQERPFVLENGKQVWW
jgi:hypothetical protein